ncbi:MAG: outer membrane beta-barrel protein [Pseudomonadota bacterium]
MLLCAASALALAIPAAVAQTLDNNSLAPPLLDDLRTSRATNDPLVVNNSTLRSQTGNTTAQAPNSQTQQQVLGADPQTTGTVGLRGELRPEAPVNSANPIGALGPPDSSLPSGPAAQLANAEGPTFEPEPIEDPYAPQPLRLGTFNVNGEATLTYGRSSNLSNSAGGTPGRFSNFSFTGGAVSDWSRHQLRFTSAADIDLNRPTLRNRPTDIDLDAALRLDLTEGSSVTLTAGYGLFTEDASSPDALIIGNDNPFLAEYDLGIQYDRNVGLIGLQLRGGLTAARYGDIKIAGQPAVAQTQRDRNGATLGARLSYDGGGRITPFVDVEYELGRRVTRLDANGFDRRFNGLRASMGANVELSGKLSGSLQMGYGRRDYADVRLQDVGGFTVDGSLDWRANDRVTVGLNLNTDFAGLATAGVSGSIARGAGMSVDWQATDALAFGVDANLSQTRYSNADRDTRYSLSASADYWLTPHAGLTGEVSRTRQVSNRIGAAYTATSVEVGLKVRH